MNSTSKFLNPKAVLFQAGLKAGQVVGDLGTGSGFYSLAAAEITGEQGRVYAVDIKDSALDHLSAEARMKGLNGIVTARCNLDEDKLAAPNLPQGECDMVVLANILHEVHSQQNLLKHAYGLLKTGGRLVIVDWNSEPGPIGPPVDKRVTQAAARKLAESSSFKFIKELETDQYHFGMAFER
jgi:ubiquinone/menaquinone biosynthesis C-methylase UbiE